MKQSQTIRVNRQVGYYKLLLLLHTEHFAHVFYNHNFFLTHQLVLISKNSKIIQN